MSNEQYRAPFIAQIRTCIGRPYRYGGQTHEAGYDCSGLVVAAMQQIGVLHADYNAQDLFVRFKTDTVNAITREGQLVFYGDTIKTITHVMIVLDVWAHGRAVLVGARGGDSLTTSIDAAWSHGAFVDTVLSTYWSKLQRAIVDPWE